MRLLTLVLAMFTLSTQAALASVTINEVAWMGDSSSANNEWIELYNSGATVSVDGWTLSDGMNLNISLTGSIAASAYAVLERTSDESASGTAFLIYTGALVNTGATLVLKNQSGSIVDQASGGENWQNIGGDNTTKETAQYSSAGWVTDEATPGQVNRSGREDDTVTEEQTTTKSSGGGGSGSSKKTSDSVSLKNTETKMVVTPEVQSVAYVNQHVPFKVKMTGVDDERDKLVRYDWNFGDTNATSGKVVSHTYAYPGKYLVTVRAVYKKVEQVSEKEITVLPVTFSLTKNEAGDIQIHNNAAYAVDVSGYTLRGGKTLVLPPRSVILSKATITVPKEKVGKSNISLVALYDTKKNMVASTNLPNFTTSYSEPDPVVVSSQTISSPVVTKTVADNNFFFATKEAEASTDLPIEEEVTVGADFSETEKSATTPYNSRWPYLALVVLLLLSLAFIVFNTKKHSEDNLENL